MVIRTVDAFIFATLSGLKDWQNEVRQYDNKKSKNRPVCLNLIIDCLYFNVLIAGSKNLATILPLYVINAHLLQEIGYLDAFEDIAFFYIFNLP
jgi:hypothetical protein